MKIGLVLSGGAAWGIANIGVLEVLAEEGIEISSFAGSSMGAIVASLPALGVPLSTLRALAHALHPLRIARLSANPLQGGLHGGIFQQKMHDILHPIIGSARLKDCQIPFVCVAGKITNPIHWHRIVLSGFSDHFLSCVEPVVLSPDTKIIDALMATSAIPIIFSPVFIDGSPYVDLVHFGAIPAQQLRRIVAPDIVIGTDTAPRYSRTMKWLPPGWKEFLERGHAQLDADKALCDVLIQPIMPARPFRFDKADAFIEAGREATLKSLPLIRAEIARSMA